MQRVAAAVLVMFATQVDAVPVCVSVGDTPIQMDLQRDANGAWHGAGVVTGEGVAWNVSFIAIPGAGNGGTPGVGIWYARTPQPQGCSDGFVDGIAIAGPLTGATTYSGNWVNSCAQGVDRYMTAGTGVVDGSIVPGQCPAGPRVREGLFPAPDLLRVD